MQEPYSVRLRLKLDEGHARYAYIETYERPVRYTVEDHPGATEQFVAAIVS